MRALCSRPPPTCTCVVATILALSIPRVELLFHLCDLLLPPPCLRSPAISPADACRLPTCSLSQITRRVGERNGAIPAEDQGGASVPATAGHGHAPRPKHLPVSACVSSPGARSPCGGVLTSQNDSQVKAQLKPGQSAAAVTCCATRWRQLPMRKPNCRLLLQ